MKRHLTLILATLVAGCTTTHTTTKCVTKEQYEQLKRDEPEKVAPKLTGRADEDSRTLAGSAVRLRSWGRGLIDVLGGCVSD